MCRVVVWATVMPTLCTIHNSVRSRALNDFGLFAPRLSASPADGTGSNPRSYGHGGVCWCASSVLGSDSSGRRIRMHSRRRASICARRHTGKLGQVLHPHSHVWSTHNGSFMAIQSYYARASHHETATSILNGLSHRRSTSPSVGLIAPHFWSMYARLLPRDNCARRAHAMKSPGAYSHAMLAGLTDYNMDYKTPQSRVAPATRTPPSELDRPCDSPTRS